MGGEKHIPVDNSDAAAPPRPASLGEGEFVVVDRVDVATVSEDEDNLNFDNTTTAADGSIAPDGDTASPVNAPYAPGAFEAVGASLSSSAASMSTSRSSSPPPPPPPPPAAAPTDRQRQRQHPAAQLAGSINAADLPDNSPRLDAAAAVAALSNAAEILYEFLYAYAVVVYHEALALVERAVVASKGLRRRWDERGPAPPGVKRAMAHRFFPVVVAVFLSLLLVLPAYWPLPSARGGSGSVGGVGRDGGGGHRRLTNREWQDKYEEVLRWQRVENVASRSRYDRLAGMYVELQAEHEMMKKSLEDLIATAGAGHAEPETTHEGYSEDGQGLLAVTEEAVLMAVKSTFEYFGHFSGGLRDDIDEIGERGLGGTAVGRSEGGCLAAGAGAEPGPDLGSGSIGSSDKPARKNGKKKHAKEKKGKGEKASKTDKSGLGGGSTSSSDKPSGKGGKSKGAKEKKGKGEKAAKAEKPGLGGGGNSSKGNERIGANGKKGKEKKNGKADPSAVQKVQAGEERSVFGDQVAAVDRVAEIGVMDGQELSKGSGVDGVAPTVPSSAEANEAEKADTADREPSLEIKKQEKKAKKADEKAARKKRAKLENTKAKEDKPKKTMAQEGEPADDIADDVPQAGAKKPPTGGDNVKKAKGPKEDKSSKWGKDARDEGKKKVDKKAKKAAKNKFFKDENERASKIDAFVTEPLRGESVAAASEDVPATRENTREGTGSGKAGEHASERVADKSKAEKAKSPKAAKPDKEKRGFESAGEKKKGDRKKRKNKKKGGKPKGDGARDDKGNVAPAFAVGGGLGTIDPGGFTNAEYTILVEALQATAERETAGTPPEETRARVAGL